MKYEFRRGDRVETETGAVGYISSIGDDYACWRCAYPGINTEGYRAGREYRVVGFENGTVENFFKRIGKYDFAWLRQVKDCGYVEMGELDKMSHMKPMMMAGNLHEGDFVETADGRVGYVKGICRCEKCRERGFYEPIVHFTDGEEDCITKYEAENGFKGYKRIGRWENEKAVVKKPKDIFHCGSVWKSENGTMRYAPDTQVMQDKINELIDAVNELRKEKQK